MSYELYNKKPIRRKKGFSSVSSFLEDQLGKAGEKRGFAVMRLLTHWREIVGEEISQITKPVKVGYNRDGLGATLTILCLGANAPILQTMLPQIKEKVNSCYGYSAISKVRITQTDSVALFPVSTDESKSNFSLQDLNPVIAEASKSITNDVESDQLRLALQKLGQSILKKQ